MSSAESLRDAGMSAAEEHASKVWKACVRHAIWEVAARQQLLTSEDVWLYMEEHFPSVGTSEKRAMGPMMTAAASDGTIEPTDGFVKGTRQSRHAAPIRVWKSLR